MVEMIDLSFSMKERNIIEHTNTKTFVSSLMPSVMRLH